MRNLLLGLTLAFAGLHGPSATAATPAGSFFRSNAKHLVQAGAYHYQRGRAPKCTAPALRLGGCTGLNGLIVWRSLPVTLQIKRTLDRPV